jgi:hypothetical protein
MRRGKPILNFPNLSIGKKLAQSNEKRIRTMSFNEMSSDTTGKIPSDSIAVLIATLSIFALGGVLHILSQGVRAEALEKAQMVGTETVSPVEESAPMTEETPMMAEETPMTEESPMMAEESPMMAEETPMTEESPMMEESAPMAEETPMTAESAPMAESPEITDPTTVENLNQQLYNVIDQTWRTYPTFQEDLVYQVTINEQGQIVSYEAVDPIGTEYANEIPLPELVTTSAPGAPQQPVANFQVVFTPAGMLEVTPWSGDRL